MLQHMLLPSQLREITDCRCITVITQRVLRDTAGRNVSKGSNPFTTQEDAYASRRQEIHAPLGFRTHMRDRHASVRTWRYSYLNKNWDKYRDVCVHFTYHKYSCVCPLNYWQSNDDIFQESLSEEETRRVRVLREALIYLFNIFLCSRLS